MKRERWSVFGLFGGALLLRLAVLLVRPFDGLYGQDAFAYYNYALELRTNLLQNGTIPVFFWPIGYPLHIVPALSVIGVSPLAAQLVSVIAGALVAPLTVALTHEVLTDHDPQHARSAALVAGLVVAVGGQLMISSLSIMSDATALLWATLSAWSVLRYARTVKWPWFGLAVLTLSLAVITRWIMALLAAPWTLAVLWAWRAHWTTIGWRRVVALCAGAALIGGVIVGGQMLSGSHTGDLRVVGWDPLNAVRRDVVNLDGVFHYEWPMAVYYAQPLAHPAYVFPLFLPLMFMGLWAMRRMTGANRIILIGWPLAMYLFLAGIAWQNPRFMLVFVPPLAVWAGVGYASLAGRAGQSGWRRALQMGVALALTGMLLWTYRVTNDFIGKKDIDLARVAAVQARVPQDATVLSFGLTATLAQYTGLRVIELFNMTADELARESRAERPAYLVLDPTNVEQQWRDKTPALHYHWLQANARLIPLAALEPYQLWRVDQP